VSSAARRNVLADCATLEEAAGARASTAAAAGVPDALDVVGHALRRRSTTAGFGTQWRALSLRLLLRAARHPMLLTLQYGGALLMATALGSAYADMEMDLYGAQNRFGLFFFILFYLCLLSMSSLPVWRDEQIVFEHEWSSGLYGYAAYYLSIVGFDLILVRAVPPLAFVFITYEWAGLRSHGDSCLYAFAAILILTNLIAALVAMMIGAVRLPNATANVIGALVVLYLALCGGYLLNPSQLPPALRWLATIDPLRCVRCAVPTAPATASASHFSLPLLLPFSP